MMYALFIYAFCLCNLFKFNEIGSFTTRQAIGHQFIKMTNDQTKILLFLCKKNTLQWAACPSSVRTIVPVNWLRKRNNNEQYTAVMSCESPFGIVLVNSFLWRRNAPTNAESFESSVGILPVVNRFEQRFKIRNAEDESCPSPVGIVPRINCWFWRKRVNNSFILVEICPAKFSSQNRTDQLVLVIETQPRNWRELPHQFSPRNDCTTTTN